MFLLSYRITNVRKNEKCCDNTCQQANVFENSSTKKGNNLFSLIIKMSIFFAHTIITSTACTTCSSVFSVLVFSLGYFLIMWKSNILAQINWGVVDFSSDTFLAQLSLGKSLNTTDILGT